MIIKQLIHQYFIVPGIIVFLSLPLVTMAEKAMAENVLAERAMAEDSMEEQIIDLMVKLTITAFENPQAKENLSQFSELIKNEYTYQFIIQKIDKFILTNELDEYEDQAEALKDALTEMRDFYIRTERQTLEKYNDLKQQQQQREKQHQLRTSNVLEV